MKRHVSYIDVIRLVASVFVVFMHTASGALRTDAAGHTGWFFLAGLSSIAFCAVPLFFMVSGYLLTQSDETKDVGILFRKRLPRLVVPLMFWSVLYIVWNMYVSHTASPAHFLKMLVSAIQRPVNISLWFMYALVAMYLISPLLCGGLRNLSRQGERLLLGIIIFVKLISALRIVLPDFSAKYLGFDLLNYLDAFGGHIACFILGWFLGKTEIRFPRPALLITALAVCAVIIAGTVSRSSAAGEYVDAYQTQNAGFEILLASCVFLLVKQSRAAAHPAVKKATRRAAKYTFPVYLMHALLILIATRIYPVTSLTAVLLETVAIYAASLLVAWLCSFVPVLSYLACALPRRGREEHYAEESDEKSDRLEADR